MKGSFSPQFLISPLLIYLFLFIFFTYPTIHTFSSHFWADSGDGLQNVWNLWWVNKATTELHQSIWHTAYLFSPQGTTLFGHTLNPFNGFLAIPLLRFFTPMQTYNLIVLFSFVTGGFTMFLLAYYFSKLYFPSIIAGLIFSFSNFHFAHLEGHLQLVSLEWLPLFVLSFYLLLTKPRWWLAVLASVSLYLTLLCDYYYFIYCLLFAAIILFWHFKQSFRPNRTLALFLIISLLTSGAHVWSFVSQHLYDPLVGAHDAQSYSLDLLAPFIPGEHSRYQELTSWYWQNLPGDHNEQSVYVGITTLVMLFYAIKKHAQFKSIVRLWFVLLSFFFVLSLGPELQIWGWRTSLPLPYALVELTLPFLRLGGVPARMMVMVNLFLGLIFTMGLSQLFPKRGRMLMIFIFILLTIEYLPRPISISSPPLPTYLSILKDLPHRGIILDTLNEPMLSMYYQSIHSLPLAGGSIARLPKGVFNQHASMLATFNKRQYPKLCSDYQVKYLLTDVRMANLDREKTIKTLYREGTVRLFDICHEP